MNIVTIKGLTKIYKDGKNEKYAINNISFSVDEGEMYAVLGHNGAGKTTLFLILATLLKPSSGTVKIFNRKLDTHNDITYIRKNIGLFTEDMNIYPYLTVKETLQFFSKINNVILKDIEGWIELLDLKQYTNYKISALSTGLRKRVSILLSVITNPKLILLDEPFSSLDPESTEIIKRLLKHLATKNTTILISSHDLNHIQQITEKGLIMKEGQFIEKGIFKDLYKKYDISDKFVITIKDKNLIKKLCQQYKINMDNEKILCNKEQFQVLIEEIIKNKIEFEDIETIKPNLEELYLKINKESYILN